MPVGGPIARRVVDRLDPADEGTKFQKREGDRTFRAQHADQAAKIVSVLGSARALRAGRAGRCLEGRRPALFLLERQGARLGEDHIAADVEAGHLQQRRLALGGETDQVQENDLRAVRKHQDEVLALNQDLGLIGVEVHDVDHATFGRDPDRLTRGRTVHHHLVSRRGLWRRRRLGGRRRIGQRLRNDRLGDLRRVLQPRLRRLHFAVPGICVGVAPIYEIGHAGLSLVPARVALRPKRLTHSAPYVNLSYQPAYTIHR